MLRCSLNFNPQSVIRYQQFALWVKMSIRRLVRTFVAQAHHKHFSLIYMTNLKAGSLQFCLKLVYCFQNVFVHSISEGVLSYYFIIFKISRNARDTRFILKYTCTLTHLILFGDKMNFDKTPNMYNF